MQRTMRCAPLAASSGPGTVLNARKALLQRAIPEHMQQGGAQIFYLQHDSLVFTLGRCTTEMASNMHCLCCRERYGNMPNGFQSVTCAEGCVRVQA